VNGVSVNGREYALSAKGEILNFPTEEDAFGFLAAQGVLVYSASELEMTYGMRLEEADDE
jgi:hypothetical protein